MKKDLHDKKEPEKAPLFPVHMPSDANGKADLLNYYCLTN